MLRDVQLNVLLPHDRNRSGWLRVQIDGALMAEFRVLGRGSAMVHGKPTGNPSRASLVHDGDTPTGDYFSPGIMPTKSLPQPSYGPWGAVELTAVSGDALLASKVGFRKGLLIHGGNGGRFDGFASTQGCLRLHNADMKKLIELLTSAGNDPTAALCKGLSVRISIHE